MAALGLTAAQVEAAACAAALGLAWPPAVRPVQIGDDLWLNVSESWSGDEPRLITACLQRIVPRYLWDGPEPTAKTVYPPAGERLSYRGRLVLVNGAEYVMAGEECERKVTWAVDDRLALPGEAAPAKERKPRKPRAKRSPVMPDNLIEASCTPAPEAPNPPGVTFAGESWQVKVAPDCTLEVRADEDGKGWRASPPDGRRFGTWSDGLPNEPMVPCHEEIARAVSEALGEDVEFVGYAQERGRPAFRLRRRAGANAAEGGLLFGPPEMPTAHEGGL